MREVLHRFLLLNSQDAFHCFSESNFYCIPAMAHMVYLGAVHSRFQHSLGVYWLAGEVVQKLKTHQVWHVHALIALVTELNLGGLKLQSLPFFSGLGAWY